MPNLFAEFRALLPQSPLLVGEVISADANGARVQLPDGAIVRARGSTTVGASVFIRDGVIEGDAPSLSPVVIEV